MSKTRLVSVLAALSLVAAPSVALAHSSSSHTSKSKKHQIHKKSKKAKRAKIRQVVGTYPSNTTPSTTTPPPAATTASITKFENGDLTITLSNGKAYTAAVTDRTEIECHSGALPTARAAHDGNDDNEGDDDKQGSGSNQGAGSYQPGSNPGSGRDDDNDDDENDDQDDDDNGQSTTCDQTALTPGTQVTEAELRIDASGGTWTKLELVK